MKIIKLDTINSTNSYLRELAIHQDVDNFTVVSAKHQSEGKGQIDKKWITEPNKNLTFSILIKEKYQIQHKKYINIAVSLALHDWFTQKKIKNLSIKWPNDIMTGSKKLSGILIETMIRGSKIYHTVIGIGINVNQQQFSSEIKSASSLLLETSKTYDLDLLLLEILPIIQNRIQDFLSGKFKELEEAILNCCIEKIYHQISWTIKETDLQEVLQGFLKMEIYLFQLKMVRLENLELRKWLLLKVF